MTKEKAIKTLADIIFYVSKLGYIPYDTDDEFCAVNIAKKHIEELLPSLPSDLKEASKKYVSTLCDRVDKGLRIDTTLESAFKAGAEWKEEQMKETHCSRWEKWKEVEETACHEYENGWKDCKEEMMSEAMEGEAHPDDCEIWVNLIGYGLNIKDGDKVRVIVLPKEDSHEVK